VTNIDVVRRLYEAWNGPDPIEDVIPLLDPAFEWVNPSYAVDGGTRHGHGGWRHANRNIAAVLEAYHHEVGELYEADDKVVSLTTFVAQSRAGGVKYEKSEPQVWTLRDGKVVRLEWFHDQDEALRAAGVSDLADLRGPGRSAG
jgi:ketosteroid isomerase-like protein